MHSSSGSNVRRLTFDPQLLSSLVGPFVYYVCTIVKKQKPKQLKKKGYKENAENI